MVDAMAIDSAAMMAVESAVRTVESKEPKTVVLRDSAREYLLVAQLADYPVAYLVFLMVARLTYRKVDYWDVEMVVL